MALNLNSFLATTATNHILLWQSLSVRPPPAPVDTLPLPLHRVYGLSPPPAHRPIWHLRPRLTSVRGYSRPPSPAPRPVCPQSACAIGRSPSPPAVNAYPGHARCPFLHLRPEADLHAHDAARTPPRRPHSIHTRQPDSRIHGRPLAISAPTDVYPLLLTPVFEPHLRTHVMQTSPVVACAAPAADARPALAPPFTPAGAACPLPRAPVPRLPAARHLVLRLRLPRSRQAYPRPHVRPSRVQRAHPRSQRISTHSAACAPADPLR
ncbi:hypothetical protein C8R44DRAFT_865233 [Mycena epipterygia]|nr:hypothetical protein C8R44DRAFT_865233 [Mycena epipterygia]